MRKGVVKNVVMTASLGLALFFSGLALADNDQVFMICAKDAATGGYYISDAGASEGASLPEDLEQGAPCTIAFETLERLGCIRIHYEEAEIPGATLHKEVILAGAERAIFGNCRLRRN